MIPQSTQPLEIQEKGAILEAPCQSSGASADDFQSSLIPVGRRDDYDASRPSVWRCYLGEAARNHGASSWGGGLSQPRGLRARPAYPGRVATPAPSDLDLVLHLENGSMTLLPSSHTPSALAPLSLSLADRQGVDLSSFCQSC